MDFEFTNFGTKIKGAQAECDGDVLHGRFVTKNFVEEMEEEDGDKRGQKQAKEFSQNLRKSARSIARENILTVFTNQLREGEKGETKAKST